MAESNDTQVEEIIEEETPEEELSPQTDWEAEAKKARGIAQRLRTKLTKATEKKVVAEAPTKPATERAPNTDGLDENALDFLDLKGITDTEDISLIEKYVQRTGDTVRQALKDEWVVAKLDANKAKRDVQDAIPSSTKRSSGNPGTSVELAIAKYEQSGFSPDALPSDFALRSAVINAIADKQDSNKPRWK